MRISYNKLWKLLIDKKMSEADLRRATKIAPNTLTRLYKDEEVSLYVLYRICRVLDADIGDVMEFLPDEFVTQAEVDAEFGFTEEALAKVEEVEFE